MMLAPAGRASSKISKPAPAAPQKSFNRCRGVQRR
jgi:hypothetical protein